MVRATDEISNKWHKALLAIVLVGILVIYVPSLKFAFYPNNDDGRLILNNQTVTHFADQKSQVLTEFVFGLYHPFTTISFSADHAIWGTTLLGIV